VIGFYSLIILSSLEPLQQMRNGDWIRYALSFFQVWNLYNIREMVIGFYMLNHSFKSGISITDEK